MILFLAILSNIMLVLLYLGLRKQLNSCQAELRALEDTNVRLLKASQTDWLLGIMNRGTFLQYLTMEYERSRREKRPFSILFIDVDNFKNFNDLYGHQKGDEVLCSIVDIIKGNIRSYDLLARYGGEELILCMPGANQTIACRAGRRLVSSIYAAHIPHAGNHIYDRVTISVGVSTFEKPFITTMNDLIREADENMYMAKCSSRNNCYPN